MKIQLGARLKIVSYYIAVLIPLQLSVFKFQFGRDNKNLCRMSTRENNNILQLMLFIIRQCSLLTALILQLNGLVITYKLLESKRNIALGAYLCTQNNLNLTTKQMKFYKKKIIHKQYVIKTSPLYCNH